MIVNVFLKTKKAEDKFLWLYNMQTIEIWIWRLLKEKFENTHKFCNGDLNKFIFLLREEAFYDKYMVSWSKLYESSSLNKGNVCSRLNLENISNSY